MIEKQRMIAHFDRIAPERPGWYRRNRMYGDQIVEICRPFLNPDSRVLELGCSTGDLLNQLKPGYGVGVDISPRSIEIARAQYPHLRFVVADAENLPEGAEFDHSFDVIIMSDLVGYVEDVQGLLEKLKPLTHPATRLIITHWNWLWKPILSIAEGLKLKAPDLNMRHNWISPVSLGEFLRLANYDVVQVSSGLLLPYDIPVFTPTVNSLSYAPLLNRFALLRAVVARPGRLPESEKPRSVTVVIPTRNEAGNIEAAVKRTPEMGSHTELLFIDGNSTDGTVEKIHEMIAAYPERDIKFMPQVPPADPDAATPPNLMLKLGKGDAVRKAFAAAKGDIVMILDSDLTMPPEELPRFYDALVTGKGRFINGTRLIYPQEQESMPLLNKIGNVFFSILFTWLLDQQITDTLCGTKALWKSDYDQIAANRAYFGDFDPFGDFDLLFGAARLGLPIVEVPVHYGARTYGDSKVRVGLHGPLLGRMAWIAFKRFKLQPLLNPQPAASAVKPSPNGTAKQETRSWAWLVTLLVVVVWWLSLRRRK
jgi:SAM-dependent methyltransferase/glycosyltransferase involved in cell wall biosynthesis